MVKKTIFTILIFISFLILGVRFGAAPLIDYFKLRERGGIRVQSNVGAKVYLDSIEVGTTPYQVENLSIGEKRVEVKSEEGSWSGYVKVNPGTLTVINRELSKNVATSSGEIITLEKGRGAVIISNPSGAELEIDSKRIGVTPLQIEELGEGEHIFILTHSNYLKRSITAIANSGYKLNLTIDLALSEADLTKIATTPIQTFPSVTVKSTPTGFLRLRSRPSVSSSEVGRVTPGEELILLEELPNWSRIRTEKGIEGYVSSAYVEKKN